MSESVSRSDRIIDSTSFGSTMAAMTASGTAAASRMPPSRGRRMSVTSSMTPSVTVAVREIVVSRPSSRNPSAIE